MVSKKISKAGKPLKLKLFDISRAYFYDETRRRVYTMLPEADEEEGTYALFLKTIYGTMDGSSVWQETYILYNYSAKMVSQTVLLGQPCSAASNVISSCLSMGTISWCWQMKMGRAFLKATGSEVRVQGRWLRWPGC